MPKLKLEVEDIESVDEAHRALYAKDEASGKYRLDVEGLPDVTALQTKLAKARKGAERAAVLEKEVERWKALGKTPDEIEEMLEAANAGPAGGGNPDPDPKDSNDAGAAKQLKRLQEKHEQEVAELRKQNEDLLNKRRQALIEREASTAISEQKGSPRLLMPHIERHVKVVEDKDGRASIRVLDEDGDIRVNAKGDPMTVGELVAEMRETDDFGRAFEASGKGGSGANVDQPNLPAGSNGSPPNGSKPRSQMSIDEKTAYIEKHGENAYLSLPMK